MRNPSSDPANSPKLTISATRAIVRVVPTSNSTRYAASSDGKRFLKEVHVLSVSKFGARIKADVKLSVGAEVRVETKQKAGATFRVVWVGLEGTPRAGEIGLEYVKMSNLLGISFPQ